MRVLLLLTLAFVLAGCRGTSPYTAKDLSQVRQAYFAVRPTYEAFKQAFKSRRQSEIVRLQARHFAQCHIIDQVDARDTIDPNVNLFRVSIGVDDMCNTIESAYVFYAKRHHLPYDKTIIEYRPSEVFAGADADIKKLPKYLKHPEQLS